MYHCMYAELINILACNWSVKCQDVVTIQRVICLSALGPTRARQCSLEMNIGERALHDHHCMLFNCPGWSGQTTVTLQVSGSVSGAASRQHTQSRGAKPGSRPVSTCIMCVHFARMALCAAGAPMHRTATQNFALTCQKGANASTCQQACAGQP